MDNQTNNQPQAAIEKIAQAKDLLSRAGISSPATRLMSETIIASKNDAAITELITGLNEMIAEKEAAYQEFKAKMSQMAKEMLPARPNSAGVGGPANPAMAATPVTPVAPVVAQPAESEARLDRPDAPAQTPPAEPVVDITPPGTMPPTPTL